MQLLRLKLEKYKNVRLLQTVIFTQKLQNVESSNIEQEKLTPHKTSQTRLVQVAVRKKHKLTIICQYERSEVKSEKGLVSKARKSE